MNLYHLGRGMDNEIVVSDDSVSRKHAQLFQTEDQSVYIIDLNSTNGTFVNGRKIEGQQSLHPGDLLLLGTKRVEWEQYVDFAPPQTAPSRNVVDTYENPPRKSKMRPVLLGTAALVVCVLVLLFFIRPSLSGPSDDPTGMWDSQADQNSWVEFEKEGAYREGYGAEVLLDGATWEKKGQSSVVIKRGDILVLYEYHLNGNKLTIKRDNQDEEYLKRSE